MAELECLTGIIGLSKTSCTCFDTGKLPEYAESKSGLYLDELQGLDLKLIGADVECGDDNIWLKMLSAVEIAKTTFRTDVLSMITQFSTSKRKAFFGKIGQSKSKTNLASLSSYNGLVIRGCNIKGAEFTLNKILTYMDSDATFDIFVYNNISDNAILQIPNIESVTNTVKENVLTPDPLLTFPLYTTECDDLEYYIVWQQSTFLPKDNKVSCGCSRKEEYEHWFDIQGVNGNVIADRESFPSSVYANGLIIDVTINCNTAELICGGENTDMDYMNNGIARTIATAIQLKAGETLINDILSSGNINRYTMLQREALYGKRNHYAKEYGMRIDYIAQNIDISGNDCLGCHDQRMGINTILS